MRDFCGIEECFYVLLRDNCNGRHGQKCHFINKLYFKQITLNLLVDGSIPSRPTSKKLYIITENV